MISWTAIFLGQRFFRTKIWTKIFKHNFIHVFLSKNRFGQKCFVSSDSFLTEENVEKNVEGKCQKIQAKKKLGQKLSQKLQQIPSKNRFKIQNNNPKNGASAGGASVVVLNFVSVFCKGLQELLAQLFLGLDFC